jgi:two-component system, NtrC family, response regulator AtoC
MTNLLVIYSEISLLKRIDHFFSGNGHNVVAVSALDEAESEIKQRVFDVILCEIIPENRSFRELLELKREFNASAILIAIYDVSTVDIAVQAIREGAFDLIQHPFRIAELYVKVEKAIEIKQLQREAMSLRGERKLIYKTNDFIAHSPKIKEVLAKVDKVSNGDSSVIVTGETGTGKELIAGTIHYNSSRAQKAFVRVNCAALPETLLESELFGHEKGAFTGAEKQRIGRFEQADGGSILLDEIGDVSLQTQVKILRVIQEKELERVGSNRPIRIDVRILSATNRNLEKMIEDHAFREDLYYRLNVITIHVPPLRERREDILPLAGFFLRKFSGDINKDIGDFEPSAVQDILEYRWPGNIRELENTIERAVTMADGNSITRDDLGLPATWRQEQLNSLDIDIPSCGLDLEAVEKMLILKALDKAGWIQKDAAQMLHISARALNYKINKYNIAYHSWKTHTVCN